MFVLVLFENKVWMQQYFMRDDTSYYKLSNIDCMSGDIEDLGVFHKDYYWAGFSIASTATFSIVNGRLFFPWVRILLCTKFGETVLNLICVGV